MSGKKLPGKPKQYCQKFQHVCLQGSGLKIWLSACPADSLKAYCEVCNDAIQL